MLLVAGVVLTAKIKFVSGCRQSLCPVVMNAMAEKVFLSPEYVNANGGKAIPTFRRREG